MFKLRYNILVGINVLLTTINAALTMRIFGVGVESDAYLLSGSILTTLITLQGLCISQFMHFYNDLKVKDVEDAHNFYNATFLFCVILGVLMFIIYYFALDIIIPVFAKGIDYERYNLLKSLLSISAVVILITPLRAINVTLFNAEMKFSVPYILEIIPVFVSVCAQIYLVNANLKDVEFLVLAQTVASFIITVIESVLVARLIIPFKLRLWHPMIIPFLKNSFTMQIGNSLFTFLQPVIINNFLVKFPNGYVSYYYYARKIIDIVNKVTIGPSRDILRSKVSQEVAKRNIEKIKNYGLEYIKTACLLLAFIVPVVFFTQSYILKFISANNLSDFDLLNIKWLYLTIVSTTFIGIFISNMVCTLTAAKKSLYLININIVYIVSLWFILKILNTKFGIYTLPLALSLALFINFLQYKFFTKKIFQSWSVGK